MKLTKTWLSYIIWGIFSIILFADIGIAAIEIYQKADTVDFFVPIVSMYAYAILGVAFIIILYKLYEKIIMPKLEHGETNELKGWQEGLILALIFVTAIGIRVVAVIASGGELSGSTKFYDYAIASGANRTLDTYNNGAYVYSGILGFFLNFLGHMPRAAMAVQAGIQSVTLFILYFAVKKGIGRFAAWVALCLASFLPGSFLGVRTCSPDGLFTLLFVTFMLALVNLCEANRKQKIRIGAHGGLYILMGLFAAFLAFYDISGWLCVVIACVAFAQSKNEDAWMKIQRAWLQILLFLIMFVAAFVLLLWFIPANGLEAGPAGIVSYFTEMISGIQFNLMILSPHKGEWDALALFIMAGLWFVGFLRDSKDKAFPYALTVAVLTLMSFFGIGAYEHNALVSVSWIVLAAIGITSLSVFRKTEKDIENAEKAKRNNEERKAEKERKRAEAAGEKSIRLDDVHQKKKIEEPVFESGRQNLSSGFVKEEKVNLEATVKKSYGIGRKADDSFETQSIVRAVEKPPVAETPVITPIQSVPAYSQGSPSRRALRQPSKSTFTPEDLERISRYTGANLVTAATIESNTQVSQAVVEEDQNIVEVQKNIVEVPSVSAAVEAEIIKETVVTDDAVSQMNYIQLENPEEASVVEPVVQDKASAEEVKDDKGVEVAPTTPALSYGNPIRRHYRHPSKSTFTPEELEKISQYTGINYKQATSVEAKVNVENTNVSAKVTEQVTPQAAVSVPTESKETVSTKTVEKTIGAASVIESKPAQASSTDVKSQTERKPKLIRNPLPGPKPHVPKELNYDYLPKESEMKFDIEDLKGRDYYDL